MKDRMDKLTAVLAEDSKMSKLDVVLSLLVALFSGIILGILFSPRRDKTSYFGCGNGNNLSSDCCDDCDDCSCCNSDDCNECDCEGGHCCKTDCDEERCCGEHEYCGNDELCCKTEFDEEEVKAAMEEQNFSIENEKNYVKIK